MSKTTKLYNYNILHVYKNFELYYQKQKQPFDLKMTPIDFGN